MELQQYSSNNVTVLTPTGRVDNYSVPLLRERIDVVSSRQPNLVIDLENVYFMDSSGLAALVYGMNHCRASGGNLYLSNPAQAVRLILELTRLDKAIDIFRTTTEAIESFNN